MDRFNIFRKKKKILPHKSVTIALLRKPSPQDESPLGGRDNV
jgi:hypothetical protein